MSLELRDAVYLSAVHSYFFDVCNAQTSLLQRIRATMNILHDCGYTLLRDALNAIDDCNFGDDNIASSIDKNNISVSEEEKFQSIVEEVKACITSSMEALECKEVENRRKQYMSCVQLFYMHSSRLLLSNNTSITLDNLASSFLTANAELMQNVTCVRFNTEWLWWNSLIASVSTSQDIVNNNTTLANDQNEIKFSDIKPLFIPVFINNDIINEGIDNDVSKEILSNHKKDKQLQHNSRSNQLIYTYNCARLYSALLCAMNAHAGTVTEMSKLLIVYIFEQEECSENGSSGEMRNIEINDWLALCMARVKGVVTGVIEYSLMCSRAATHCTVNALDELANTTTDPSTQPSTSLESSTLELQEQESIEEKMETELYKNNAQFSGNEANNSANHKTMQEWQDGWLDKFAESSPHYMKNVNMTLQMAAITLTRLVEQCELLVNTLKAGDRTYANNCVSNWLHQLCHKNKAILGNVQLSENIAVAVTHVIQELLYTLILGRSTEFMWSRPDYTYDLNAKVAINNKQRDSPSSFNSTSSKHTRGELFKPTSVSSLESSSSRKPHSVLANGNSTFLCDALSVVTSRGLYLAEADGLLLHLFPTVLQQTGYEWPWSAFLKQLRALDKEEQISHHSSDSNKEIIMTGNDNCGSRVRWSSRCVIEMLLLRLATAFTYPARLTNILPSSYDRIIDSIGLVSHTSTTMLPSFAQQAGKFVDKHKHQNEDNTSVDENGNNASVMFALPAYYKEAATPLLSYIYSAASRVSVHEVERILIESTSALPMTARLRTLVARTSNDTHRHNTDNNYLNTMEEEEEMEEQEEEEEDNKSEVEMTESAQSHIQTNTTKATTIARLARELCLSAIRVNGWEWRYRLEVLMSVLIVYTQLATPSALQQFIRTLQPLIASAYTAMRDAKLTEGVELIARTSANRTVRNVCFNHEAQVLINYVGYQFYTLEWLPMVAHVYHTSLLAHNATASTLHNSYYHNSYSDLHSAFITPCVHPYSVAAAMAHQFNLHIKSNVNTTLSSSLNTLQQNQYEEERLTEEEQQQLQQQQLAQLPVQSSQESTMAVPLNNFTTLAAFATASIGNDTNDVKHKINHERITNNQENSPYRQYERVHRFFNHFIHACFLISLTSPCELEGPLAVSATRKIGSHSINEVASSSAYAPSNYTSIHSTHNYSSASALSILRSTYADVLNARCYRQWCKAVREIRLSSHHVCCDKICCCRVECKCNTDEMKTGKSGNAEAYANVKLNSHDDTSKSIKGGQSVERIGEALLHFGAHSFSDVLQASDGLLACLQCFLPSSVLIHEWASSLTTSKSTNKEMISTKKKKNIDDKNKMDEEKSIDRSQTNVSCTDVLQDAAWQWCESTLVPYSQSGYLRQSLHNMQNNTHNTDNNKQANKHHALSFQHSVSNSSAINVGAYNSCTFDAASLSRETVRRLLHQLLSKMEERLEMQEIVCNLHQCHHSQHEPSNSHKQQNDNAKDACKVNVDPFLLHQWRQLRIVLQTLTLCSTESLSLHANNTVINSVSLSALTRSMTTSQADANVNSSTNAAYYMWHSPYFADEFKLSEDENQESS